MTGEVQDRPFVRIEAAGSRVAPSGLAVDDDRSHLGAVGSVLEVGRRVTSLVAAHWEGRHISNPSTSLKLRRITVHSVGQDGGAIHNDTDSTAALRAVTPSRA
jgi:hypothetical protein